MSPSAPFLRRWSGTHDAVPTMFIHGAGSDHAVWLPLIERLRHLRSDLYAVDLPGHGQTPGPSLRSIEAMGEWIATLVSDRDLPQVSLVGHSMGSLVALECAVSVPEAVERLVLVATSDRMAVNPLLQRAADDREPSVIEMILQWSFTGDAEPNARRHAREVARMRLEASLQGVLADDLRACDTYDPVARAAEVRCPVLVVGGSKDLMTPGEAGRRLADAIAGSEYTLVEGGGHNTLAENPEPIARLLEGFLGP